MQHDRVSKIAKEYTQQYEISEIGQIGHIPIRDMILSIHAAALVFIPYYIWLNTQNSGKTFQEFNFLAIVEFLNYINIALHNNDARLVAVSSYIMRPKPCSQ